MMRRKKHVFLILYFLCFLLGLEMELFAQVKAPSVYITDSLAKRLDRYTDHIPLTSLYLRTSKEVYESMEDLWFKVYSLDARYHTLATIDKTLYIQLIKQGTDSVYWKFVPR